MVPRDHPRNNRATWRPRGETTCDASSFLGFPRWMTFLLVNSSHLCVTFPPVEVGSPLLVPSFCTQEIPSGYVKIAIEHGHRNSDFSYEKLSFSIVHNYGKVYARVCWKIKGSWNLDGNSPLPSGNFCSPRKKVDVGMGQKPQIFGGMNIHEPSTEVSLGRAPRAPGPHGL